MLAVRLRKVRRHRIKRHRKRLKVNLRWFRNGEFNFAADQTHTEWRSFENLDFPWTAFPDRMARSRSLQASNWSVGNLLIQQCSAYRTEKGSLWTNRHLLDRSKTGKRWGINYPMLVLLACALGVFTLHPCTFGALRNESRVTFEKI